jgi:hypothetical protein
MLIQQFNYLGTPSGVDQIDYRLKGMVHITHTNLEILIKAAAVA